MCKCSHTHPNMVGRASAFQEAVAGQASVTWAEGTRAVLVLLVLLCVFSSSYNESVVRFHKIL